MTDILVELRTVANGYVIRFSEQMNNMEVTGEFVAVDIEEALSIVRDICVAQDASIDMSHLATNVIK